MTPSSPTFCERLRRASLASCSALLLAGALQAANPHYGWIELTVESNPGRPASITVDPSASGPDRTVLDIEIYGFWRELALDPTGRPYDRITVPGLGVLDQLGAPDLPAARFRLALGTDAPAAVLRSATLLSEILLPDYTVAPRGTDELDPERPDPNRDPGPGRSEGSPSQWRLDPAIYGSRLPWPSSRTSSLALRETQLGGIPAVSLIFFPMQWNPATRELRVARRMRLEYDHAGGPVSIPALTKDRYRLAEHTFANFPSAGGWIAPNTSEYTGRYLFVAPRAYLGTLEPLLEHRKACGFAVTVITTEETTSICGNIRGAIDAWYRLGRPEFDHYCLLVGDTDVIPHCLSSNVGQYETDDLYGSPSDGDLSEEVHVGRLSVDDASDLAVMIDKILEYELAPVPGGDYDQVVLAAHKEDAPGKYVGAHEAVAQASYAVSPTFLKEYGPVSSNQLVSQRIDQDVGVVAYRGHGSTTSWSSWNHLGQSFHKNDVLALLGTLKPVVWSFSCWNNHLSAYAGTSDDSIGEAWMEHPHGAVAHYGSTDVSSTSENHVLDLKLFEAVYQRGITVHGQAIAWTEEALRDVYPSGQNPWMYCLLGEPVLRIRRRAPIALHLVVPGTISDRTRSLTVQVRDAGGNPVPGALVSAWKGSRSSIGGGGPAFVDEVLVNAYADRSGQAVLPLRMSSAGRLQLRVRDEEGNFGADELAVQSGAWTDLGDAKPGSDGKPVLSGQGSLQAGTPLALELDHAAHGAPAVLFLAGADWSLPVFGGTLHTAPGALLIPFLTDARGSASLGTPAVAPGVPGGLELYFQAAILDRVASQQVALSNALRAVFPGP